MSVSAQIESLDPEDALLEQKSDAAPSKCRFLVSGEPFDLPWDVVLRPAVADSYLGAAARWALDRRAFDPADARDPRVPLVELPRDVRSFRVAHAFLMSGAVVAPETVPELKLLIAEAGFYQLPALVAQLTRRLPRAAAPTPAAPARLVTPPSLLKPHGQAEPERNSQPDDGKDEKKAEEPSSALKTARFWIDGPCDRLTPEDAQMRAADYSAQLAFGRGEDATALLSAAGAPYLTDVFPEIRRLYDTLLQSSDDIFRQTPDLSVEQRAALVRVPCLPCVDYLRLLLPAQSEGLEDDPDDRAALCDHSLIFNINFSAITLGLNTCFFDGLPLVCAGGAVLSALHVWPCVDASTELVAALFPGLHPRLSSSHAVAAEFAKLLASDKGKPFREAAQSGSLSGHRPGGHVLSYKHYRNDTREMVGRLAAICGFSWTLTGSGSSSFVAGAPQSVDIFSAEGVTFSHREVSDRRGRYRVEEPIENRCRKSFRASDVDLFLVTRDPEAAVAAIRTLYARLRAAVPASIPISVTRTANAVSFQPPWPYRKIQVILRLHHSVEHVLHGFDVDCCCVAFDGRRVLASPRGLRALRTRANVLDPTLASPTYEPRLMKYACRGFAVAVPGLSAAELEAHRRAVVDRLLAAPGISGRQLEQVQFAGFRRLVALMTVAASENGHIVRDSLSKDLIASGATLDEQYLASPEDQLHRVIAATSARDGTRPLPFVCAVDDLDAVLTANVSLPKNNRNPAAVSRFGPFDHPLRSIGVPATVAFLVDGSSSSASDDEKLEVSDSDFMAAAESYFD